MDIEEISGTVMKELLMFTAWEIDRPELFGQLHIVLLAAVVLAATFCAVEIKDMAYSRRIRILAVCGWILAVMEIYKQLFLYYVVNNGVYDWWYFPFQLCSVPMYLCILLPLSGQVHISLQSGSDIPARDSLRQETAGPSPGSLQSVFLTFMGGFTFISTAAALLYPQDFLRIYVTLTLHGFIWHGILLFISLTVFLSGMADLSPGGFVRSAALFLILCAVAVCINIAAEPAMSSAYSSGLIRNPYAAMFYLNPYHISPQPVVSTIQKSAGIPMGLALYIAAIAAASWLTDSVFRKLTACEK